MNILAIIQIIIQICLHIPSVHTNTLSNDYLSIPIKFIDFSASILMHTSSNRLYFNLDLTNNISLVTNAYYFEKPSPLSYVLHSETITTYNNRSTAYKFSFMKDKFVFRENPLSYDIYPYLFFYAPLDTPPHRSLLTSLSLCHYYHNYNHSLVHQYYNKGLIRQKVFGIWFNINKQYDISTYLYIGGVPRGLIGSNYVKYSIEIPHYEQKWKFKVKDVAVDIGDNHLAYYKADKDMFGFISLTNDDIQVDNDFFQWIHVNIFEKLYYKNNTCRLNDKPKQIKAIECQAKYIQYFPKIYVEIQQNIFELNKNNLFNYYTDTCLFLIKPYKDTTYNYFQHEWVFGYKWLQDYFIEFNYETDAVTIYMNKESTSNTNVMAYNSPPHKRVRTLYILTSLLLVINALIIIVTHK